MRLDAQDVAGEIKVQVELVNVLVFILRALLRLFFLQRRLGDMGLDRHQASLAPVQSEKHTRYYNVITALLQGHESLARVDAFSQCFHIGERLGVFGDHIGQDVLHTRRNFLHSGQTCQ